MYRFPSTKISDQLKINYRFATISMVINSSDKKNNFTPFTLDKIARYDHDLWQMKLNSVVKKSDEVLCVSNSTHLF